jgi:hypothetical protein
MKFAVTNHAVDRYKERVEGADQFDDDSVRQIIRSLVKDGFRNNAVRPHPRHRGKQIIPFTSGKSVLYISIGPNETGFDGEFAVVGVLFEKDITEGKVEMGVTLGDKFPQLSQRKTPRYHVLISNGVNEPDRISFGGERELQKFLSKQKPEQERTSIYVLVDEDEKKRLFGGDS